MSNIVDIEKNKPGWLHNIVECNSCHYYWVAVYHEECKKRECPSCHRMTKINVYNGTLLGRYGTSGYKKKSCRGKVKYKFKEDAIEKIRTQRMTKGGFLVFYKCQFCNDYHVGHTKSVKKYLGGYMRGGE